MEKISNPKSLFGMFFICPLLGFIMAFKNIMRGNTDAIKIVPYFMGLYAYLFPPYSDFARNLSLVYEFKDMPLQFLLAVTADPVVPTIEYYFINNGIPIEIFRFIYTFFIYYLFNKIFLDIKNKYDLEGNAAFKVWFYLFMIISFFTYIINLRTLFVCYSLFYCIFKYFENDEDKFRYYSLLLCFVHFAYFPIVLAFFFSKFINIKYSPVIRNLLLVLTLFGGVLSGIDYVSNIFNYISFGEVIDKKIQIYTEGEWSEDGEAMTNMRTLNYIIYTSLLSLSTYYVYYLFIKRSINHEMDKYLNLLLLIVIIMTPLQSLFSRYLSFVIIILYFYVIYGYVNGFISEKSINILLALFIFNALLNTYAHWNCLVNGYLWCLFMPLPYGLLQTYNFEEWCKLHLEDDFNNFINTSFLSR